MSLSVKDRCSISAMVGLGVPPLDIADEFGVRVHDVLRIDRIVMAFRHPVARPATAMPKRDWQSARPAVELYRASDPCFWPNDDGNACTETRVEGKPYCFAHCCRAYRGFEARSA